MPVLRTSPWPLLSSYHRLAGDRVLPLKAQSQSWPLVSKTLMVVLPILRLSYAGDVRTANCELTQGLKFGGYAIVKNQFALRGGDHISDF